MPVFEHDQETARRYLLGQLVATEEQEFETRLLTDDELAQELEVSSDEVVHEYRAGELTADESEWLEQHYLSSPEGKRSYRFASAVQQYISRNTINNTEQTVTPISVGFWNPASWSLRTAAAFAVLLVVAGIFWVSRSREPQSFANVTLSPSAITRSGSGDITTVKLNEDALRVKLLLPTPSNSAVSYRAELMDAHRGSTTLQPTNYESQSVTFDIPRSLLAPGLYAIAVSTVRADQTTERIPGNYQFKIE